MAGLFKTLKRRYLKRRSFPASWFKIIERNVPYYRKLPAADRKELEGHVLVFLAEKKFEGCGGLKVTEEMRVTIAAYACILLLHRKDGGYADLESILVYPACYLAKAEEPGPAGTVTETLEARLGEAWRHGTVVLSWDDVKQDAQGDSGGHNVVLHEFAHLLDQQDGDVDGTPPLRGKSSYISWARVLGGEYRALQRAVDDDRPTLIDKYGAEDPAEFFAVVTECFFENPVGLKKKHPELYEELKRFYLQDPATLC